MPRDATYEEGYYNGLRQAMIEIYCYGLDAGMTIRAAAADELLTHLRPLVREARAALDLVQREASRAAAESVSRTQGKATPS